MADQQFSIQQKIFEIASSSRDNAYEIHCRVSGLVTDRLMGRMESYFNLAIPEDQVLYLDHLQLDLGEVSLKNLEEEVEERFMQALEKEIGSGFSAIGDIQRRELLPFSTYTPAGHNEKLLQHFLYLGTLPWWAPVGQGFSINQVFDELVSADTAALKKLLQETGKDENSIRRLVNTFSEERLMVIVRLIEPAEATYVLNYYHQVTKLQQEKQVVKSDLASFKKAAWFFMLNYLLVDTESIFSKKMFLKSNLLQLAAHYNISYFELLRFFYVSIGSVINPAPVHLLQSLIGELYSVETEGNKNDDRQAYRTAADPGYYLNQVELLEYYLHFGTIPHTYENLAEKEISGILISLAHTFPAVVKKLLLAAGIDSDYRKRIYEILGPGRLPELLELTFPEDSAFFIKTAALFTSLQEAYTLVRTGGTSFNRVLWQYLLEARVIGGEGQVDEQFVMGYVIDRLDRQFGDGPGEVWLALEAAMTDTVRKFPAGDDEISQFRKLLGQIKSRVGSDPYSNAGLAVSGAYPAVQGAGLHDLVHKTAPLKDVLRFLLRYGSIPWWGKDYFIYSTAAMLEELYQADRRALAGLVRMAGQYPHMKERLLVNMTETMALELLPDLPSGDTALESIGRFFVVLKATGALQYYDEGFVKKMMFDTAWKILSGNGYHIFPELIFYFDLVRSFSALLKVNEQELAGSLKLNARAIPDTREYLRVQLLMNTLFTFYERAAAGQTISGWQSEPDHAIIATPKSEYETATANTEMPIPGVLLQSYFDTTVLTPEELLREVMDALLYFLTWNRLPDRFNGFDRAEQQQLIRQVLIFGFENDRTALRYTITKQGHSPAALAYLGELMLEAAGGAEKTLHYFIQEHTLRGLEAYSREQPGTGIGIERDRDPTNRPGIAFTETFTGDGIPLTMPAPSAISYYIENAILPGEDEANTDQVLRKLMRSFFNEDPSGFENFFKDGAPDTVAKLHLYDLFVIADDTDPGILAVLNNNRNETFIKYLLNNGKEYLLHDTGGIGNLVSSFLQDPNREETFKNLAWVFSSPSFAAMLIDISDMSLFVKLATFKLQLTLPGSPVVQQLLGLLQGALQHKIERDRTVEIFKQFNIIFIAGHIRTYTDADYAKAFFNYLWEREPRLGAAISRQIIDFADSHAFGNDTGNFKKWIRQGLRTAETFHTEKKQTHNMLREKEEADLGAVMEQDIAAFRNNQLKSLQEQPNARIIETKDQAAEKSVTPEMAAGTRLYINNAGLILFHLFFNTYLERVGLLEGLEFKDKAARDRAVNLLQYLAKGPGPYEEHELVLNKLLCGVPLAETISTVFSPTDLEKEVTNELYEVFIERWPQMKNTSAESIRYSFLLRNGVLKWDEEGWWMRVEQRSYDIILQTLPWAFGIIKTPMMDKLMMVEWI